MPFLQRQGMGVPCFLLCGNINRFSFYFKFKPASHFQHANNLAEIIIAPDIP